ncbi:hypothetical protein BA895_10800 [Humibacillus sp. DSM 29435]|nr:hypothetical protein BA895_10800 [Humibacillus sp. DSM 29435]
MLLTLGVVVLLFVVYLLWWTGVETSAAQSRLTNDLGRAVASAPAPTKVPGSLAASLGIDPPPPVPATGEPYLDLTIPRLGDDWRWVVVQGVGLTQLALGPGHYPGTVGPGEVGNFAVAAHRSTHGEPFAYLDRMLPGDLVRFSFGARAWTYRVDKSFLTDPSDVGVLDPVPGEPTAKPTRRLLTLTTCDPRWGNERRLIVVGTLVKGR